MRVINCFCDLCPCTGCWLHSTGGGCGGQEVGAHQSREACSQLHDGHTADKAGKVLQGEQQDWGAVPCGVDLWMGMMVGGRCQHLWVRVPQVPLVEEGV